MESSYVAVLERSEGSGLTFPVQEGVVYRYERLRNHANKRPDCQDGKTPTPNSWLLGLV